MDKNVIMNWDQCKKEFIRYVDKDNERADSIAAKAMQRLERARNTDLNHNNVSFIVEDYYEVIKELLVAYLLNNGLRAQNHQCLISYFFMKNPEYENEAYLISQMSFFRNRLTYYGEDIPMGFYEKNKKAFEQIVYIIKNLIKK